MARTRQELPIRVDTPLLPLGIAIFVLAFVGLFAAVPAAVVGMVALARGLPFFGGFFIIWIPAMAAYAVRMVRSRIHSRFILYEDRLVSRYPHPRRLRWAMQEDVLKPEEVRHLDRSGRRIILRHGRHASWTRIDVKDADGLWAALLAWRRRAGGLYSSREAGGAIAYSQRPLGDPGQGRPFVVVVRREGFASWRIDGSGVRIVLEQQDDVGEMVVAVSPPVVVYRETNRPSAVYELQRTDGLLLGTWRGTGRREGELTVAGVTLAVRRDAILEGNCEIGEIDRDFDGVSEISFKRESRDFAELAAVLITAVSNAHEEFERRPLNRAEP